MDYKLALNRLFGFADDEIVIPTPRTRSQWINENKHGFLVGIAEYGFREDKDRLSDILESNSEEKMAEVEEFIESCYQRYIAVFHQHSGSSYRTPPSRPSSRANSRQEINGEHAPEITDSQFRHSVRERDGVCLFCWNDIECNATHIVAKKDVPVQYNERSILDRVGLDSKNQVQNGLYLCSNCHGQFDKLKRYVDVVEENGNRKYVVKVVKGLRESDEAAWEITVNTLKLIRQGQHPAWPTRDVETNGELALWFMNPLEHPQNERASRSNRPAQPVDLRPNVRALQFHKAACLIWRMAGGAEEEDEGYYPEYDSDVEPENVFYDKRTEESNRPAQPVDLRPNVKALEFHRAACLIWRMAAGAEEEDEGYYPEYDSDVEPENVFYDKRTEEFVSATVVALEESLSREAFKRSFVDQQELVSPK
ncbi:hypothetical protein MP638_001912 [Amoeboaphelidium occidentale]|nr:hypothetical protein MP638_001912 [Amoeboaphelidium occidentale]